MSAIKSNFTRATVISGGRGASYFTWDQEGKSADKEKNPKSEIRNKSKLGQKGK
jgi:hypothetical protein